MNPLRTSSSSPDLKHYRAPDLEKVCVGKCIVSFCLGVLTLAVLIAALEWLT